MNDPVYQTAEARDRELRMSGLFTFQDMLQLFLNGLVGTKEFRNWLAIVDPNFAEIRDADVDNEIDRIARERQHEREIVSRDAVPDEYN